MDAWVAAIISIVSTAFASTGFWAWIQRRELNKNSTVALLRGLAHDRIVFLGMSYIDRGWLTKDEYEDFLKYLYIPYTAVGGNGLAERVMAGVKELPIRGAHHAALKVLEEKE